MHRIMTVPRITFARVTQRSRNLAWRAAGAGLVLAVLLSVVPGPARAQMDAPTPSIILPVNGNELRKMSTGKKIKTIAISDQTRINVSAPTPTEVFIVGMAPGISRVTLTDENDRKEMFDVIVVQFDIRQLESVLRKAAPTANIRPIPAGTNAVILQGTVDRAE